MNELSPTSRAYQSDSVCNLAKAIAAVMAKVERLKKADDNAFAKYRFTSVDDYKDFLRPLMAENGLTVCMNQTGFNWHKMVQEKDKKEKDHCQFDFQIWLVHSSGEISEKEYTTVCLPYAMAQTTGQARSYALKEWLKSKFLASSGDLAEDADAQNYDIQLTKAQARDIYESLTSELRDFAVSGVRDDLIQWHDRNKVLIEAMPNDWNIMLRNEFKQAQVAIKLREKGASIDPFDWDQWMTGYENQIAVAITIDDLQEIAAEHEDTIKEAPSAAQATAKRLYREAEQKVRSNDKLV